MAKKKADGEEKVTKADAVRKALADGIDKPQEGSTYIKEKFGLDVTPQVFSSYKSLGKKKVGGRRSAQPDGQRVGNSTPAELARAIKELVEQHGADAVAEMVKVFE